MSQIPSYEEILSEFAGLNTQVLGISVDHIPCLEAWSEHLGGITYPLLSDFWPHGRVAENYGVLRPDGVSERAIFVIDSAGIIRYIDIHDYDEQPSNDELLEVLRELEPGGTAAAPAASPPGAAEVPQSGVILYCTNWCPACRRARRWLEEHQIEFTEVNITHNRAAAARVRDWANGYETTPTFDIDGIIVVNFDEEKLRAALARRLKE